MNYLALAATMLSTSTVVVKSFTPRCLGHPAARYARFSFQRAMSTPTIPEYGTPSYGLTKKLQDGISFNDAMNKVTDSLKQNGFGVLTEIDMRATMKKKLDVDLGRPYTILGACSPKLSLRALQQSPAVGLFLPCNVAIAEDPDGRVVVSIINPEAMFSIAKQDAEGQTGVEELAKDVQEIMEKVIESL